MKDEIVVKALEFVLFGCVFILLVAIIFLPFGIYYEGKEYDRLMKQCLQDGKKEYQCVSLLKVRGTTRNSTVVVPQVRGR